MSLIQLENITKEYILGNQRIPVLFGVDLKVEKGEFISIMGPSGSGKSTLMNILGCLDRPTTGTYLLNDQYVESLDDHQLSSVRNLEIGFVFQKFNLLADCNALQNIALPLVYRGIPKKIRYQLSTETADKMGIGERLHHKPNELSGGQAQRVAIARALRGEPHIILADEPTGNLDSKTGKEILEIFFELHRQGNTIIMVTHDEKVAKAAQRIVRIGDGKILSVEAGENTHKTTMNSREKEATRVGLRWLDLFFISLREGLLAHPLRSLLTMLGVLFGVSAVISMLAINEGARQEAIEQIQQMGLYNIRIRSLNMTKEEIREARRNLSMGLNQEDWQAVSNLPTVKYAVPIKEVAAEVSYANLKPKARVLATFPIYQKVSNFRAFKGRFINQGDIKYFSRVCALGQSIKQKLFANEKALGRKIYIGSEIFVVVGIMESKNAPKGVVKAVSTHNLNNDIYIPLSTALKRFRKNSQANELDEISIMVHSAQEVHPTTTLLSKILTKRHNEVNDFEIVVPEELLRQSRKTQEIFDVVMVCIASISLLVGGIGIMNIMLASVTERIKEIGVRRAIGASQKDILKQFLVEAITLSVLGGALGLLCGWGLTLIISVYTGWQTIVTPASIILGFGVSSTVGILFGIYPAWKAALLDPIEALNTT